MVSTMMSVEQVKILEGYKQTEVGVIPEDWEVKTVDELASKVGSGKTPSGGSTVYVDQGIPLVRSQNVGWGKLLLSDVAYITKEVHDTFLGSELKENDVLLNITGASIGRSSIANATLIGGNVNQHVCIIRVKDGNDPRIINSLILSNLGQAQIDSYQAGGNREGLNFNQVKAMKFPLPEKIKEQTAIANALSDVDNLIASLETLIAKKSAIKTAAMQQLLTGKKRLPGFENKGVKESEKQGTKASENKAVSENELEREKQGSDQLAGSGSTNQATQSKASEISDSLTKSTGQTASRPGYKQTELGEIPEDWEIVSYENAFKFLTTASNSRSDLTDVDELAYIHYGDIHTLWDIKLDFSKSNLPKIAQDKVGGAAFLQDGDVVMADASEDYAGVGKSIEIQALGRRKAIAGLHTFLLRDKGYFVDGFRGYLHLITSVKSNFDRLATGLKVYGLSKNSLKEVLLPVPPKQEQTAIANVLSDMDTELDALQQRLAKTQTIKQGMMQELLTGKTRLI
jgi:type I restriction enzyme S subunit